MRIAELATLRARLPAESTVDLDEHLAGVVRELARAEARASALERRTPLPPPPVRTSLSTRLEGVDHA
jgi:hypothetical protein